MRQLVCKKCEGNWKNILLRISNEIFVKFMARTIISWAPFLEIEGYHFSRMIQYMRSDQHFRCIKLFGRDKIKVMDNEV